MVSRDYSTFSNLQTLYNKNYFAYLLVSIRLRLLNQRIDHEQELL